ncbi:hypothetical protein HK104_010999 [Borealophlyctis nickersoniae]|nr:hypothetical protein HK104_010999 [Borealophlyctis nickersoniae]
MATQVNFSTFSQQLTSSCQKVLSASDPRSRSRRGTPRRARLLLEEGADVHAHEGDALYQAAGGGQLDVVRLLLEKGASVHARGDEALRSAAEKGQVKGADVYAWGDEGLCLAAGNGHLEVIRVLLENGADVRAGDDQALRWAARNGSLEVAGMLLEADVHAQETKLWIRRLDTWKCAGGDASSGTCQPTDGLRLVYAAAALKTLSPRAK